MKTLGQAAKEMEIPKGTLRGWVDYYADYLSESARPPKGQVKLLDDDDMAVLWTVYFLRAKHKSKDEIAQALAGGELYYPEESAAAEEGQAEQGEASAVSALDAFTSTLQLYETRIESYEERINNLTDKLIESETSRAAAEAKLEVLEEQQAQKVGWWDRLLGRG